MKPISGKQLARLLEKHGWQLLRIQGSHHIYGKTGRVERLSVPVHGDRPLKVGLLHHLLRLAGLTESDLE
ncbi:MAG: type II toxin-antitoxin system HicA family toxin [Anaerolineae bacterium]|nr:type II toxin-antitoxin system HicA family toxin [Anaerolineae bacterium]